MPGVNGGTVRPSTRPLTARLRKLEVLRSTLARRATYGELNSRDMAIYRLLEKDIADTSAQLKEVVALRRAYGRDSQRRKRAKQTPAQREAARLYAADYYAANRAALQSAERRRKSDKEFIRQTVAAETTRRRYEYA